MHKSLFVLLGIPVLFLSAALMAQLQDPPELETWWRDSGIVAQLQLTESQIGKIEQRFLDYQPALADLTSELKDRREELSASRNADPIDEAKIRNLTKVVAILQSELQKANSFLMTAFRKELTKKQWDKLQKIRESRQASMPATAATSIQSGEQVYRVGGPIKAPKIRSQSMAQYTPAARAAGIQGNVLLRGVVRKDGRVTDLVVVRGLGYGLDESAIETVSRWRFDPATLDGQPVNVQADIGVTFR